MLSLRLTTLCYALAAHFSKKYLQQIPVEWIAFVTLLSGMLVSDGGMLFSGQSLDPRILVDPIVLLAVVGLGVFGSGLAYIIFYTMIQKGTAEFAILVTYLVPPFAIVWGVVLLQEPLHWRLFIGLIFILTGVFIAGRHKKIFAKMKSV
jgi:drug/metabolite transporter (DMT)-like permease